MRIGEVSRRLGVCADTIRRLEREGLISVQRDRANQRRFTDEDVAALEGILFPARRRPLRSFVEGESAARR